MIPKNHCAFAERQMFGSILFDRRVECRVCNHYAGCRRNHHPQMTLAVTIPQFDLKCGSEFHLVQVRIPVSIARARTSRGTPHSRR
jgi:hypothetical protein